MASVAQRQELLVALVDSFGDSFDTSVHGVTWASTLEEDAQRAIGEALESIDPGARRTLVSLVLAYRVDPLMRYCGPYAGALDGDDPGVIAYAEQIAEATEPLGEFERELLVNTGTWSTQDVIDCFNRNKPGCESWDGKSPLSVLAEITSVAMGEAATPASALRLLRSDGIDAGSAQGLAAAIGGAEYANRSAIMGSMMLDMTASNFPRAIRVAIASAATGPMCEYDTLRDYFLRAQTSDPDRFDDPGAPWPTFVRNCAERHWDREDLVRALSAGSWLGVPREHRDDLMTQLLHWGIDEQGAPTCEALSALGQRAYDGTPWVLMRGIAHTLVAEIGGERCRDTLRGAVEDVLGSAEEHPEARLRAASWLLAQGSRAGCGQIDAIMDWHHEGYDQGAGAWAESQALALRQACQP